MSELISPAEVAASWHCSPSFVRRELHRATTKLGLPRITQHALRHISLTLLADAGVPEDVRQRRAGHSTASMARRYTAGAEAPDRQAADALQNAIGGKP
jgi:integrase